MPVHITRYAYAAFSYNPSTANKWTTQSVHRLLPDITKSTLENGLAILGEYGWDFAGTVPVGGTGHVLIFKRPEDTPARSEPSKFAEYFTASDGDQARDE